MMRLISFEYNGAAYVCFTPENALKAGVPQSVVDAAIAKAKELGQWSDSSSAA